MGLHSWSVNKNIIKPHQVSNMYQVGRGGAYLLLIPGQDNQSLESRGCKSLKRISAVHSSSGYKKESNQRNTYNTRIFWMHRRRNKQQFSYQAEPAGKSQITSHPLKILVWVQNKMAPVLSNFCEIGDHFSREYLRI